MMSSKRPHVGESTADSRARISENDGGGARPRSVTFTDESPHSLIAPSPRFSIDLREMKETNRPVTCCDGVLGPVTGTQRHNVYSPGSV